MDNQEEFNKIDIVVNICKKSADLLKDPTEGGKKELKTEERTKIREESYCYLLKGIDTLASLADCEQGFLDMIYIAQKIKFKY